MDVESRDPTSGEVVCRARAADATDVEVAVAAAARAQTGWERLGADRRADVLRAVADAVEGASDDLAALVVREVGKRRVDAAGEVAWTALSARWYADHPPRTERVGDALVERRPLGVVAAVTPWNVPLVTPAWKWLPALVAGDAVVWKPSPAATGTALAAAELVRSAGLPEGLLTVLPGGAGTALALAGSPGVAGVHFTGSTAAGRALAAAAAPRFARCALEMGGLNVAVVLPDADLPGTAEHVVASATALAGQKCSAVRRVLVHEGVADDLEVLLRQRLEALVVGLPDDDATDVGPLVSPAAAGHARSQVRAALERGGRVVARSPLPAALEHDDSPWVAPVVLADLPPGDPLETTELFAPVVVVERVGDGDDVGARAGRSGYGLCASVHGADAARVAEVRQRLRAGVVVVNGRSDAVGLEPPFGGHGLSGNGMPEGGEYVYGALTDLVATYGLAP